MNPKIVRPREAHERKTISNGDPKIVYEGRLGAIVNVPMLVDQGEGYVERMYEHFVRPPGTRIIAVRDSLIYLQKEYRSETATFDWRLPGGKVMDSFDEFRAHIGSELPIEIVIEAGRKELLEEAHLKAGSVEFFKKSACGASVEWDLYYLIATELSPAEHTHDEGEEIVEGKWFSKDELLAMCVSGEIGEDRTVAALYQFLKK